MFHNTLSQPKTPFFHLYFRGHLTPKTVPYYYKTFFWDTLYSFEVDTLEIVLLELSDLVDTFFLIESNGTHKGVMTSSIDK